MRKSFAEDEGYDVHNDGDKKKKVEKFMGVQPVSAKWCTEYGVDTWQILVASWCKVKIVKLELEQGKFTFFDTC